MRSCWGGRRAGGGWEKVVGEKILEKVKLGGGRIGRGVRGRPKVHLGKNKSFVLLIKAVLSNAAETREATWL